MEFFRLCSLTLIAVAASEDSAEQLAGIVDEAVLESRINFTIESDGPHADINLLWEPFPCLTKELVFHQLTLCNSRAVCLKYSTYDRRMVLKTSINFPIIFWSHYDVSIEAHCLTGGSGLWARRNVDTGPGALLPPEEIDVVGGYKSATLKWPEISPFLQEMIDHLEIKVCRANSGRCDQTLQAPPGDTNCTIGNLSSGTEYVVLVHFVKVYEEKFYTSAKVSEVFATEAPPENDYPPVQNFSATVESKQECVDIVISYEAPEIPPERILYGVLVEVLDFRGQRIVESNHAMGEKVVVAGLPYFSMLGVKLRALYKQGEDLVESAHRELRVPTGVTEVTKPEIVKLMAVNGTTALIHWSHRAPRAAAFSYLISKYDGDPVEVDQPDVDSVLLTDLVPEKTYVMKVSAYIHYDGKHYHQDSDEGSLKMLPKDALVPKIAVGEIVGEEVLLEWDIILPAEEKESCSLWISSCHVEANNCSETGIVDNNSSSVWLSVEPAQNYNITMRTRCLFFDNLDVDTTSDTLEVFTANRPPTPTRLQAIPESPTSILARWELDSQERNLHTGFIVRWSRAGEESWLEGNVTTGLYRLEKLAPATRYNISVAGYSIHGAKLLMSKAAFAVGRTLFPAPSSVKNLEVQQVSFSRTIRVKWDPVAYEYGSLRYGVSLECFDERSVSTAGDSIEFKATHPGSSDENCRIGVSAHVKSSRAGAVAGDRVWKSIKFKKLPIPEKVRVKFVSDGEYLVTLMPPEVMEAIVDLRYQVTGSSKRFLSRVGNSSLLIKVDSFYTNLTRLARFCLPDICGNAHRFTFLTNTGAPGAVVDLEAEAEDSTKIHITWGRPAVTNGPIDGYLVSIVEARTGKTDIVNVGPMNTSYEFEPFAPFYSFEIKLTAFNLDLYDESRKRFGEAATVTLKNRKPVPPPPVNFSVVDSHGQKHLEWTSGVEDEFDVRGYRVMARPKSASGELTFFSRKPGFEFSQLTPYTDYRVEVSSCLDVFAQLCGEAGSVEVLTDVGRPSDPHLRLLAQNGTRVHVELTAPSKAAGPIDGYQFSHAPADSQSDTIRWKLIDRGTQSLILESLLPFTRYILRVRAFNEHPNGVRLCSSIATLEVTTGGSANLDEFSPRWTRAAIFALTAAAFLGLTTFACYKKRNASRMY